MSRHWSTLIFWRVNAFVWCVFTILFYLRASLHFDTQPAIALSIFQLTLCIILSVTLNFFYRKLQIGLGNHLRAYLWIVGLSLVATAIQSLLAHFFVSFLKLPDLGHGPFDIWLTRAMFFWLIFLAWSLLFFWLWAEREAAARKLRAEEARHEAERLELQLLRNQLDPHFLFNALNGIATTIPTQPETAQTMVRELSDYLRYSLDHRHNSVASLDAELESLHAYLKIEQARFGDRLQVAISAEPLARHRQIPCFLLQPVVENAFKHCFDFNTPPWRLEIHASTMGERLLLSVKNSGRLQNGETSSGVGLETLNRRLELSYPSRHRFSLREDGGLVVATLELEGLPCSV